MLVLCLTFFLVACQSSGDSEGQASPPIQSQSQSQAQDLAQPSKESVETEEEEEEKRISFYGVGDNLIHSQIFNQAALGDGHFDFTPIYQHVEDEIQAADLALINQESPISGDEIPFSGYPMFNTPEDMRHSLIQVGFDIVIGANNHTMDNGSYGAQNTIDLWEQVADDILFTGVFDSQKDRDDIVVVEEDGLEIAVLSYTYGTNGLPLDEPYRTNLIDEDLIRQDVKRAKAASDFVMVSMHWGDENTFNLNDQQVYYSQLLADLEVDVVVGGHSHNLQPIEWLEGQQGNETLVIYSLGNFIASPYLDINSLGGAIRFDFVKEGSDLYIDQVQFQPTVIHFENGPQGRHHFQIYNIEDYTTDLASRHGMGLGLPFFYQTVDQVIDDEFLSDEFLTNLDIIEDQGDLPQDPAPPSAA